MHLRGRNRAIIVYVSVWLPTFSAPTKPPPPQAPRLPWVSIVTSGAERLLSHTQCRRTSIQPPRSAGCSPSDKGPCHGHSKPQLPYAPRATQRVTPSEELPVPANHETRGPSLRDVHIFFLEHSGWAVPSGCLWDLDRAEALYPMERSPLSPSGLIGPGKLPVWFPGSEGSRKGGSRNTASLGVSVGAAAVVLQWCCGAAGIRYCYSTTSCSPILRRQLLSEKTGLG